MCFVGNMVTPQHHTDWGLASSSPWEESEARGLFKQQGLDQGRGKERRGGGKGGQEGREGKNH